LLKDSIRIVTTPPTPQRQLATVLKDLRLQRGKLSRLFTILLDRLPLEEAYLLQMRAAAILHELDILVSEIEEVAKK